MYVHVATSLAQMPSNGDYIERERLPRQIRFDGEPADVVKIHEELAEWVSNSIVPKLFINAEPGGIIIGPYREFCRPAITNDETPLGQTRS